MKLFQKFALSIIGSLLVALPAVAQTTKTPTLQVVTPTEGQTIYGNKVPVLFSVENLEIVDYQKNPTPKVGQGHIHLWIDDENPTAQSATKVTSDSFTASDVDFGQHSLRAELVGNNHQSLKPAQVVTLKFNNQPISSPSPVATTGFDKNTALVILVVVALVIIAAWWYTKEEDKEMENPPAGGKPQKKTVAKKKIKKRRK